MHKNHSAFNDVARKFSWFEKKGFRTLAATLPFWLGVLVFLMVWRICSPVNIIQVAIEKGDGPFIDSVLLGNAVLVVIVSAVFYLFKDSQLDFGKVEEIVEHIKKTLTEYVSKEISPDKFISHEKKGYPTAFLDGSKNDFMSLRFPNETLKIFSNRIHQVTYALIFFSTAWAMLHIPLKILVLNLKNYTWDANEYDIFGLFLSSLTIMTIGLFGILYIPVKVLKDDVRRSIAPDNIKQKYAQFAAESENDTVQKAADEAIQRIDKLDI